MDNTQLEIEKLKNEISMLKLKCQTLLVENRIYREAFGKIYRINVETNIEISNHKSLAPEFCKVQ